MTWMLVYQPVCTPFETQGNWRCNGEEIAKAANEGGPPRCKALDSHSVKEILLSPVLSQHINIFSSLHGIPLTLNGNMPMRQCNNALIPMGSQMILYDVQLEAVALFLLLIITVFAFFLTASKSIGVNLPDTKPGA